MPAADPIDFFRPVRVRGDSVDERISSLKLTAEKVISDSEGDLSSYRVAYAEVHRDILDRIDSEDAQDELSLFYELYNEDVLNLMMMIEEPGRYDAIGRIMAELEVVLDLEINRV
jgi:hypothetical protein